MLNRRMIRLGISLVAALVITGLLVMTTSERQVVYKSVIVASQDIEANSVLTPKILELRNVPATAIPENAMLEIPSGKLAGQKIWEGEYLLQPMVKDDPVALPEPENRIFSIPISIKTTGGIQPGDRVDILLYTADKINQGSGESKLLFSDITIVQILNQNGQVIIEKDSKALGTASVPAVAEVLVTADEANLLNAAANTGTLSVARYLPESQPVQDVSAVLVTGGSIQ